MSGITEPYTFAYTAHGVEFDAYIPSVIGLVPILVFYHAGGMVAGSKRDMVFPVWLLEKCLPKGILVISANFRLLYPSTTDDIIADTHDLFTYLANPKSALADLLISMNITCDAERIAVFGVSGGNYLARAAATLPSIRPRPKAWISLYGMAGDFLLDDWVQPHTKDGGYTVLHCDPAKVSALMDYAEVASDAPGVFLPELGQATDTMNRIGLLVQWYRTGTILDYILGVPGISEQLRHLPYEERLPAIPEAKRRLLLPVNRATSPAFLIHGSMDNVVPYAESLKTWHDLQQHGVKTGHAWVEGENHAVDLLDRDNMPNMLLSWEGAIDKALAFIVNEFETN